MFWSHLCLYVSGSNFSLCVCSLTSRFIDSYQLFVWMRQKTGSCQNLTWGEKHRRHVGVRKESRVRRKNVRCLFKFFFCFFFWHVTFQVEKHTFQTCINFIKKNHTNVGLHHHVSAHHDNNNIVAETDKNIQFALRSFGSKLQDLQPAPAALRQFVISTNKTHYNIVILYKSSATMTSWLHVLGKIRQCLCQRYLQLSVKTGTPPRLWFHLSSIKNPPQKKVNLSSLETDKTKYSSGNDTWP